MLVTGIQCSSCGSVTSPRFTHPVGHPYTLPAADAAAATAAGASPGSGLFVVLPSPHSPLTPRRVTVDGSWGGTGEALLPVGNSPLSPNLSALHQQHFAEQVELLEQQAAEHDALLAAHEEQQEELKAGGMSFKHRLQYPFVQLLSCTMPRVSSDGKGLPTLDVCVYAGYASTHSESTNLTKKTAPVCCCWLSSPLHRLARAAVTVTTAGVRACCH